MITRYFCPISPEEPIGMLCIDTDSPRTAQVAFVHSGPHFSRYCLLHRDPRGTQDEELLRAVKATSLPSTAAAPPMVYEGWLACYLAGYFRLGARFANGSVVTHGISPGTIVDCATLDRRLAVGLAYPQGNYEFIIVSDRISLRDNEIRWFPWTNSRSRKIIQDRRHILPVQSEEPPLRLTHTLAFILCCGMKRNMPIAV